MQLSITHKNQRTFTENITKIKQNTLSIQTLIAEANLAFIKSSIKKPRHSIDPVSTSMFVHHLDCQRFTLPKINKEKKYNSILPHISTPFQQREGSRVRDKRRFKTICSAQHPSMEDSRKRQRKNYSQFAKGNIRVAGSDPSLNENFHKQENIIKRKPSQFQQKFDHKSKKRRKKFIEIDILLLQTCYVKSMRIQLKKKQEHEQSMVSMKKNKINLPEKDKLPDFIKNYHPKYSGLILDEIIKKGNFAVDFNEGNYLYFGETKDTKMHGMGVYLTNSTIFQGEFNNSQKITGLQITQNGIYKGRFLNNQRSKMGQFFWNNGQYYTGEWNNNQRHGTGMWKSSKGDIYIGSWVNGKVQGYGVHISQNFQKYQGNFKDYLKEGQGKQTFPNGDSYHGQFKAGKPHGKGTYKWKNQIVYEGDFSQGFRTGKGILYARHNLQYEGSFLREKPHGKGVLLYSNGDNYIGNFRNGKKQGEGILKMPKKRQVYKGYWEDNKFIETNL